MAALQIAEVPDKIRTQYDLGYEDRALKRMTEKPRQSLRNGEDVQLLKFPSTKNILWDHSSIGNSHTLHISCYRKPKLCISEKILRFIQRHAESTGPTTTCVLVGTMNIDEAGDGVVLSVERMDPVLDPNSSSSHAAGDMLIPFTVQKGFKDRSSSVEDYCMALQLLKQRCCSKDPVELANFLLTKGWCSFYSNGDNCVHHLEFDMVTMATEIKATPISPVPIVPSALSKNLAGPMSISHMQGTPKTGYLTMDHTRKLLLVLESDPKVVNLPLVGIWVSGINEPYSPFVWTCCLRYLYNSSINDRVCSPPEPFLLVLYNPTHSRPEFYECSIPSGTSNMCFDIYTGYEAVQLEKTSLSSSSVEVTMDILSEGKKLEQFEEAISKSLPQMSTMNQNECRSVRSLSPDSQTPEDSTPRLKPAPYTSKQTLAQSLVPEVSLFFGEDDTFVPNLQYQKSSSIQRASVSPAIPSVTSKNTSVPQMINSAYGVKNTNPQSHHFTQGVSEQESSIPRSRQLTSNVPGSSSLLPLLTHTAQANSVPAVQSLDSQPRPPVPMYHSTQGYNTNQQQLPPHQQQHLTQSQSLQQLSHQQQQHPAVMSGGPRPLICNCPSCPRPPSTYPQGPQPINTRPNMAGQRYMPPPAAYRNPQARFSAPQNGYQTQQGPGMIQQLPNSHISSSSSYPYNSQPYPPTSYAPSQSAGVGPPMYPAASTYGYQQFPDSSNRMPSTLNGHVTAPPRQTLTNGVNSVPIPQASGGLPTIAERSLSPKTPIQSNEFQTSQEGPPHRSNNSSDNSGRSSDDSGLSFTPEKNNSPSTAVQGKQAGQTVEFTAAGKGTGLNLQAPGVNWDNIPPEIYQLLMKQDQQLKQLQAQIELLTSQQATMSMNASSDSQVTVNKSPVMQTAATNTSLLLPESIEQVSACMQTSQQDSALYDSSRNSEQAATQLRSRKQLKDVSHSSSGSNGESAVQTPYEIRNRGKLPMNSTQREDAELDISQGELVALMNNMHECTIDSVQSDMIVDLPSFQSSPSRSPRSQESYSESTLYNTSPRSPVSASMCEQGRSTSTYTDDEEEEEDNTAGTDNPEYYTKLMDNIRKLLSRDTTKQSEQNDETERGGYDGDMSSDPSTPVRLAKQDINLGAHLQSFLRLDHSSRPSTDTTFIPKINYVSMFLDSDTDTSLEINAMAMKYLKDEQLTQLTKLQAKNKLTSKEARNGMERTALLQRILKAEDDHTPNVTTLGMSPNDLTFATKRYMEKHGLLDMGALEGSSVSSSNQTYNDSYQLKTNYSTMSSAGSDSEPGQVTHEILGSSNNRTEASSLQATPTGRYQLDSFNRSQNPSQAHTPNSQQDSKQGQYGTPRPLQSQGRVIEHRRFSPGGIVSPQGEQNTYTQNGSPFAQNNRAGNRDIARVDQRAGGFVSPHVTPAPTGRKTSPTNGVTAQYQIKQRDDRRENEGFKKSPGFGEVPSNQRQVIPDAGTANYYSTRQHREETNDDDRILDITRLKLLPKLL